jgi:hypothetical protein
MIPELLSKRWQYQRDLQDEVKDAADNCQLML